MQEEGISSGALQQGKDLWPTLEEYINNTGKPIVAELEYKIPIGDTNHRLVGRLDAIVDHEAYKAINEYKSAGATRKLYEFEKEWRCAKQADSVILGARFSGHDARYVDVVIVQAGTPPNILPIRIERTEYELEYFLYSCGQTADIIEMLGAKYGWDKPWPHVIHSQWAADQRGSCNNGWCEFKDFCGQELTKLPAGFKQRPEEERLSPTKLST